MRFRRSFCETWRRVSVRVVPELTEHPGAEYDTKSWQGAVDVGVRVCLKMGGQAGLELSDLAVELGDDAHLGAGGGAERRGDRGRGGSRSDRSAGWIWRARAAVLRFRPPRLSADWIAGKFR